MGRKPMINPDIGGVLDTKAITIGGKHILVDDVAYNYVGLLPNE
jgi:hypothetical protein